MAPFAFFIVGSGNGLLPAQHQAITWTNINVLSTEPLRRNLNEIWIKMWNYYSTKILDNLYRTPSVNWSYFTLLLAIIHHRLKKWLGTKIVTKYYIFLCSMCIYNEFNVIDTRCKMPSKSTKMPNALAATTCCNGSLDSFINSPILLPTNIHILSGSVHISNRLKLCTYCDYHACIYKYYYVHIRLFSTICSIVLWLSLTGSPFTNMV